MSRRVDHALSIHQAVLQGASKNVGEAASARQKQAKKRSLRAVNEHFEPVFNAAMATQVVFRGALQGAACRRVVHRWMKRALSTPRDMFRSTFSR